MKSLYKKIGVSAFISILVLPVLSQGLIVHASYKLLNGSGHKEISFEAYENFVKLIENEDKYKYYFKELKEKPSEEEVNLIAHRYRGYSLMRAKYEYNDIYEFKKALKNNVFKIYSHYEYRNSLDPIFIRIGSIWYKFFFNLSPYQKDILPIKECFKDNGFVVLYASRNDSIDGWADLHAYILNDRFREIKSLQGKPKYLVDNIVLELIKGPKKRHIFKSFKLFEMEVENLVERSGYYIYRVGKYDILVHKK